MNIPAFFRYLNMKIEKYHKMTTNPFLEPQPIVVIWVEEPTSEENKKVDK